MTSTLIVVLVMIVGSNLLIFVVALGLGVIEVACFFFLV